MLTGAYLNFGFVDLLDSVSSKSHRRNTHLNIRLLPMINK